MAATTTADNFTPPNKMPAKPGTPGSIRKRIRIQGDKFCMVCGDKALAHHFGALACESCKAFFRRNALRQNELKACSQHNSCQIGKESRRTCPCCRLAKCFTVGMKPELIFDEHQKKDLLEKVKKTKVEKQRVSGNGGTEGLGQGSLVVSSTGLDDNSIPSRILPTDQVPDTCSSYTPFPPHPGPLQQHTPYIPPSDQHHSSQEDAASHGSELRRFQQLTLATEDAPVGQETGTDGASYAGAQPMVSVDDCQPLSCPGPSQPPEQMEPSVIDLGRLTRADLPSDPHMYLRLSEGERMLLSQLACAYEDTVLLGLRHCPRTVLLDSTTCSLADCLADYEALVKQVVELAKRLDDFQRLEFQDRIACFKAAIDTLVIIHNCYAFVAEHTSWLTAKGEITLELHNILIPGFPFWKWRTELSHKVKALAKNDVTIYCLLHCILLFNPRANKVADRQLISSLRDKYLILLKHYLEATFSFDYSEEYFKEMQAIIVNIQDLCQREMKFAIDTNCHMSETFLSFELLQELHTQDR